MGREVKRVPLDFDWPLKQPWRGYKNPHYIHVHGCAACENTGYNPATRQIADDWYDFAGTDRQWCADITQDEVDALVAQGRLRDLTHTWSKDMGWKPKDPPYQPTAADVNRWEKSRTLGHDAINRMICVKTRAERLGVWGLCETCDGDGETWDSPEDKAAAEAWQKFGPPTGDGWQLWENVSEGSPISPVFATEAEFKAYLRSAGYNESDIGRLLTHGFAWSMVAVDGRVVEVSGVSQ